MRKITQFFNDVEDYELRNRLFTNFDNDPDSYDREVENFRDAVLLGFDWGKTPEGCTYWNNIYENGYMPLREQIVGIIKSMYPGI